ncbi:MAG: hypothetical protein IT225_06340, partial [Flavobacteriales bacterium]|nr:hypothetical protein [Flavobacteriales bacterium]
MNIAIRFALVAAIAPGMVLAQEPGPNLVSNGGFETRSPEVKTWDQLSRASGWSNANGGSVDVFSKLG